MVQIGFVVVLMVLFMLFVVCLVLIVGLFGWCGVAALFRCCQLNKATTTSEGRSRGISRGQAGRQHGRPDVLIDLFSPSENHQVVDVIINSPPGMHLYSQFALLLCFMCLVFCVVARRPSRRWE